MEFAACIAAWGFLMLCLSIGGAVERVSKSLADEIERNSKEQE